VRGSRVLMIQPGFVCKLLLTRPFKSPWSEKILDSRDLSFPCGVLPFSRASLGSPTSGNNIGFSLNHFHDVYTPCQRLLEVGDEIAADCSHPRGLPTSTTGHPFQVRCE
jgi:hypothetical protein